MTDYFVWKADLKLVGKFAHFKEAPDDYDLDDWVSGLPMKKRKKMTLVTDEKHGTQLTDCLLTGFEINVFSEKLVGVLIDAGVKNIEYHGVDLVNHETDEVYDGYGVANILGQIACLDEDNSTFRRSRRSSTIISLRQFKLDQSKVKPTPHMHKKALIFRLAEFPFVLIVEDSLKKAIEDAGITGVEFVAPEAFIG